MPLSIGTRLGPYEILALVGVGGMGEVYRACDTKLGRDVALKVLPSVFASDPDRMARFEREARVLAWLNHANIATLHGLEDSAGVRALVMEFVEGPTLAERIARGPMALDEALPVILQIIEALEYAHDRGVIHRDLKPANVKVTPEGQVKLLDFGLARAMADEPAAQAPGPESPTLTLGATQAGVILGTAGYMSPEQVNGKRADRRADIWAFGVVLYEMLIGKPLFGGETTAEILSSVLKDRPSLEGVPAAVRPLLGRCLEKNPRQRLQAIGEARIMLENPWAEEAAAVTASTHPRRALRFGWIVAALAMVAGTLAFVHFRETPPEARVVRTFIPPPEKTAFVIAGGLNASAPAVLSPDGRRLAFGAAGADGKSQIWVRPLDSLTAQPLAGTEGATLPFWSPDSRYLAFFAGGKLKKIDTLGGPPLALCDAPSGRGGTWNQDGVIVFSPNNGSPLHRVSAAGGVSTPVTKSGPGTDRFPWFLPDGRHFLYSNFAALYANQSRDSIRVASIDSNQEGQIVVEAQSNGVYSQGHLLFMREDALMAQPFDVKRLVTTGEAVPVAESVQSIGGPGRVGVFSVSATGLLAYQPGGSFGINRLAWFDRSGKQTETLGDPAVLASVHVSPDRKSAAVSIADAATNTSDIWLVDVARGLRTRFTFDPAVEAEAIWSPDGSSIVFDSSRKGHADLYRKASNGAGAEDLLYTDNLNKFPKSWSPDGKFVLYRVQRDPKTRDDLWVLPLTGDRKPFPFAQTAFNETNGQFSPDGRWIAYQSDESQRYEIYVAPFPGSGGKRQISTAGGTQPRWRRDGKEIFYISADGRLVAAEVSVKGSTFEVGSVRPLFGLALNAVAYHYDVSADGQRFLAIVRNEQPAAEPLTLVQNWTTALKK